MNFEKKGKSIILFLLSKDSKYSKRKNTIKVILLFAETWEENNITFQRNVENNKNAVLVQVSGTFFFCFLLILTKHRLLFKKDASVQWNRCAQRILSPEKLMLKLNLRELNGKFRKIYVDWAEDLKISLGIDLGSENS